MTVHASCRDLNSFSLSANSFLISACTTVFFFIFYLSVTLLFFLHAPTVLDAPEHFSKGLDRLAALLESRYACDMAASLHQVETPSLADGGIQLVFKRLLSLGNSFHRIEQLLKFGGADLLCLGGEV